MNITGQQALILAGEYLPAGRGPPNLATGGLALPSGGAVLQRLTVVASRPDETLVLLRADYSSPASGRTYEALANNANGSDTPGSRGSLALPAAVRGNTSSEQGGNAGFGAQASLYLSPTAQYARTQARQLAASTPKGAVIDVHA